MSDYLSAQKLRMRGKGEVLQLGILGAAAALAALLLAIAIAPGAALAQDDGLVAGSAVVPDLTTQKFDEDECQAPTSSTVIKVGETKEVSLSEGNDYVQWFKFTPEETGGYIFESSMPAIYDEYGDPVYDGDPYGALYAIDDEDMETYLYQIAYDDDDAEGYNFKIVRNSMQAGKTYYLACSDCNDDEPRYLVTVKAVDKYSLEDSYFADYSGTAWVGSTVTLEKLGVYVESHADGSRLTLNKNYALEGWYDSETDSKLPSAPTAIGSYYAKLKGLSPYHGTLDVSFDVGDPYDLSNWNFNVNDMYNDKPVTLANLGMELSFKYDNAFKPRNPVAGTDYKVTWFDENDVVLASAPVKPGWYSVEIEGIGKTFKGSRSCGFSLYDAKDISDYASYSKHALWANGAAATLNRLGIVLYRYEDARVTLKAGVHFAVKEWGTVTYDEDDESVYTSTGATAPKAPGEYYVKLAGKAPYKGERTFTFRILDTFDLSEYNYDVVGALAADGKGITLAQLKLSVYREDEAGNKVTLKYGTDYAFDSWKGYVYDSDESLTGTNLADIKKIGEYRLAFKGKGKYKGEKGVYVDVVDPKNLSYATISGFQEEYYGTGPAKLTPVVTSVAGVKLTAGTHYTLSIGLWDDDEGEYVPVTSYKAPGEYRIRVEAKEGGGYSGSRSAYFDVYSAANRIDISKGFFIDGVNASYPYTGKSIAPKPVVRSIADYGETLSPDSDYSVAYTPRAATHTVTITVTGKGIFTGKLTRTFKITGGPAKGKTITVGKLKYKVTKGGASAEVAFLGSKKAAKVKVPATIATGGITCKVTSIAAKAFNGNKKLKSLTIGANVKKIGAKAAKGCKKLKSVTVASGKLTKSAVKNLLKGSKIKTIKLSGKAAKAKKKAYQKYAGKKVKVK